MRQILQYIKHTQKGMNVATVNLANVSTPSFKNMLYTPNVSFLDDSTTAEHSMPYMQWIRSLDMSQGGIQNVSNPLRCAIDGNGFFQVLNPDGSYSYTRDGNFMINQNNQLAALDGRLVMGQSGEITLQKSYKDFKVSSNGIINATDSDGSAIEVGQLAMFIIPNPSMMQPALANSYNLTENSGDAENIEPGNDGAGMIVGSSYEDSNIDQSEELTSFSQLKQTAETLMLIMYQTFKMRKDEIDILKPNS